MPTHLIGVAWTFGIGLIVLKIAIIVQALFILTNNKSFTTINFCHDLLLDIYLTFSFYFINDTSLYKGDPNLSHKNESIKVKIGLLYIQ